MAYVQLFLYIQHVLYFEEFVHDYTENIDEFLQADLNNILQKLIPDNIAEGQYNYPGEKHYEAVASWPNAEVVSSKELLLTAKQKHFAIPSANFVDEISAKAHIEVAEEMNLPLILSFAQVHSKYQSLEEAANIGKYYANKAKVPVVLHLDHGEDFDFIKELLI